MATFYISFANGSDANNGLGPDASHATNKPWKTLAKLLGAAGMASGDTAYVAPGVQREVVTVAMTSATAETQILADPTNARGFKTSGGVLLDAAEVRWTGFLTDDKSAPSASATLTLSTRDFLTFEGFTIQGTQTFAITNSTGSTDIKFRRCKILPGNHSNNVIVVNLTALVDAASNYLFDSCIFFNPMGSALSITLPTSASADYSSAITVSNCLFLGGGPLVTSSGAASFKGGGVSFRSCTLLVAGTAVSVTTANVSTSLPITVYDSLVMSQTTALSANTSGQLVEDWNILHAPTARTNVSTGSNSQSARNYGLLFHLGESAWMNRAPRPAFMPTFDSPLLAFGSQSGAPTTDALNRPRPAGGAATTNASGCLERHDTAVKSAAADADGAAGAALKLVGPSDQEILVPVDATSTTLSIKVAWDSTHGDTNKPQAILLANGEIGVVTETKTAAGSAGGGYETLTFSAFTPTAKGVVTLRLVSRAAAGGGIAWFDTASVPAISTQTFDYFRAAEPLLVASNASTGSAPRRLLQ